MLHYWGHEDEHLQTTLRRATSLRRNHENVLQDKDTVMLEIRTIVLPVGNHTTLGRALRVS